MIKRASLQHIHDNDQRVGLRHPTLADKEGSSLSIRPGEALHAIVMAAIDLLLRTGKRHQLELSSSRCRRLRHAHARLFDLCEDGVKLWLPRRRVHDDLLGLPGDLFNLEACSATSARCSSRVVWHGPHPPSWTGRAARPQSSRRTSWRRRTCMCAVLARQQRTCAWFGRTYCRHGGGWSWSGGGPERSREALSVS
jgi:hypothetical protein